MGAPRYRGAVHSRKEWKYYEAGAIGFGLKTLVDLAEQFNEYGL
jgi:hypothetical protein